jgi:hypothetical protein
MTTQLVKYANEMQAHTVTDAKPRLAELLADEAPHLIIGDDGATSVLLPLGLYNSIASFALSALDEIE